MWERFDNGAQREKTALIGEVEDKIKELGFTIVEKDLARPWGGFLKIAEEEGESFLDAFFGNVELPPWAKGLRFDPKILLVKPATRLSWQYHDRRGEFWRVVKGPVGTYLSPDDEMPQEPDTYYDGQVVEILQGVRHRLAGLDDWGIVAEIWIHTNPEQPSNEDDNHRLADDFGRSSPITFDE